MFDSLKSSLKSSVSSAFESEAAATKAKIVIKKGGKFLTADEANDDMAGLFDADIMSEVDSLLSTVGIGKTLTGYTANQTITVLVNPQSFSIYSKSNFKPSQLGGPAPEEATYGTFEPTIPRTLDVTLFYDVTIGGDYFSKMGSVVSGVASAVTTSGFSNKLSGIASAVTGAITDDLQNKYLDELMSLTRVLQDINTPPLIAFDYGSIIFEGYATNVDVEYKRFDKSGKVIRAEVKLTIEEADPFQHTTTVLGAITDPSISSVSDALDDSIL